MSVRFGLDVLIRGTVCLFGSWPLGWLRPRALAVCRVDSHKPSSMR